MSINKRTIPFCPKCGNNESVSILSKYFGTWKCDNCNIKFDFSKLTRDIEMFPKPREKAVPFRPLLSPVRKVFFEQDKNRIKLIADLESFNSFIISPEIQSLLPTSLGKKHCNQSGHIDLDKGTIDS